MRLFRATVCVIGLFAVLLAGASAGAAEWDMFRQGPQRLGSTDSTLSPPLSVKWTFEAEGPIFSSPVASGGTVFVGSRDNRLYAIDESTGLEKWRFETDDWIDSTPAVYDGKVYAASRDGNVYAIDAKTGGLLWKSEVGGTHCSSPMVSDGRLVLGAGYPGKFVVALDVDTGKELWKFETGQAVYSSAAHLGDTIFIGANDGKYYALNPVNGEEKWSAQTKGGIYFSTPAVKEGIVFAAPGDYDRNIYAWKAGDGEPAWKYNILGSGKILVSSPAADGEVAYIVAGYPDVKLYALEQSTGALLWATPAGTATQHGYLSSPAVGSEYLWIGTGDGKLLTIDKASGKIKNEIDLGEPILSSPALTEGKLLVASTEGILYALW